MTEPTGPTDEPWPSDETGPSGTTVPEVDAGPVPEPVAASVAPPAVTPPATGRTRGRVLRGGLLAAALAVVVALDTGTVPLPFSTPSTVTAPRSPGGTSEDPRTFTDPGTDPAATAQEQTRDAAVEQALASMTDAYTRKDEAAYLTGFDPGQAKVVERQRTRFRNLRAIGYDTVTFTWPEHRTWTPSASAPANDAGATADPVTAGVVVTTRISRTDARESVVVVPLTFAWRQNRWLVVSDSEKVADIEGYTASEPWMLGPVYVVSKPHAVVVGERKHKRDVDQLARQVEQAVGDVRAVWKQKSWNGKVVVYAVTDKRFVDAMFGGRDAKSDRTTKEAVFDAKVEMTYTNPLFDLSAEPAEGVPRMVVTPFLLTRHDAQATAVLRHELTHVAFAYEGGDNVPTWLVEGIAEYTGFRTGGASVDGVGALGRRGLPRSTWTELKRGTWKPTLVADPVDFYSGSSKHVADTYTTGWLTCLYIADTYGEQSLAKLYARAEALGPDTDPETAEAAILQQVLTTNRKALTKGTTAYARRIRSRFV